MRAIFLATLFVILIGGCASSPLRADHAESEWRVVPLATPAFPDRAALLLNTKTGDTWIYNSSDKWVPVKRQ
jgi:hypothetical protein